MIKKINMIKQNKFFQAQENFFLNYRKKFIEDFVDIFKKTDYNTTDIENFYSSIFDFKSDFYNLHFDILKNFTNDNSKIYRILAYLFFNLIKEFANLNIENKANSTFTLMELCFALQDNLLKDTKHESDLLFDVIQETKKDKDIIYLLDAIRNKEEIKLISYKHHDIHVQKIKLLQVGKNSFLVAIDKNQALNNFDSFMVVNEKTKEFFSLSVKFFSYNKTRAILENITKLKKQPLLNRKYSRVPIAQNSLVQIIGNDEIIIGSLIDISQGGIGILSSQKSNLKKGDDIGVILSYEDMKNSIKLDFKTKGILTSKIGKENAFRYGVELMLCEKEKDLIKELVENKGRGKEGKI